MENYISKEQFSKFAAEIHEEMFYNKFNEQKSKELRLKLKTLKKLRAQSLILELEESKKQKGL